MNEIEALLSVDRGEIPPATVAFFERDPIAEDQRLNAILGGLAGLTAAACALAGLDHRVMLLFVLIASILVVTAWPAVRDPAQSPAPAGKRFVTVVTAGAIIVRDAGGLRSWRFDELAQVISACHGPRPYIVLIEHDGRRHALDYLSFQRGEDLRDEIGHRLRLRAI